MVHVAITLSNIDINFIPLFNAIIYNCWTDLYYLFNSAVRLSLIQFGHFILYTKILSTTAGWLFIIF